jgi:CheY-like chemotaxis protein
MHGCFYGLAVTAEQDDFFMSLVGNLEDLGLGEILQIVSLSRKSGVLELNSLDREGRVVFRDGEVIRATSSAFPENLGDILLRKEMVDLDTMRQALVIQQQEGGTRRFGEILVDEFGADKELIEASVREQVERVVYSFFSWNEGSFSFVLGEPDELGVTALDPLQFILKQGLSPQWLAMEGSRILDEKRHAGEDLDERGESLVDADRLIAEALGGEPPAVENEEASEAVLAASPEIAGAAGPTFLIVDDDPATAEGLAELLQERRARGRVFTGSKDFLDALQDADPADTALVIDLIMPRKDGSGILGGLELLEDVRCNFPDFQVLVMSDHPSQEAEQNVRKLGVPVLLPKPKKVEIAGPKGREGLSALVDVLLSVGRPDTETPREPGRLFNIGAELMQEMGEAAGLAPAPLQQSPGLHLLRGMLQELSNPSLGGGIILLILRFASELMSRAVIFLVKGSEIVGLGQFGIELAGESPDIKVRNMRIPLDEENVFTRALKDMSPRSFQPPDGPWINYLFDQLGGERPEEVFIGPLLSEGRVVAVLYGDNLPEQKSIGDTEALEIFLSQAGLAMEKALLERRLMTGQAAV